MSTKLVAILVEVSIKCILQDFKDYVMYDIFKMYSFKYILKYKLQIKLYAKFK